MHTGLHLEDPWIGNDKSASGPSPILDFVPPYEYYNQTQMAPSHGIVYCRAQSKCSEWYNRQRSIFWSLLIARTGSGYIRLFRHFDGELRRTTVRKIHYQKCSGWTTGTHFACMAWAYIWSLLRHLDSDDRCKLWILGMLTIRSMQNWRERTDPGCHGCP
jgi:hypothetical protein